MIKYQVQLREVYERTIVVESEEPLSDNGVRSEAIKLMRTARRAENRPGQIEYSHIMELPPDWGVLRILDSKDVDDND